MAPQNAPEGPVRFRRFEDFWPYYVREHLDAGSRRLHFAGTALSFLCLLAAALRGQPFFLLGALLFGYGFAWSGHFFLERNRPATFRHPFYSLLGDWRMFGLILNGKMQSEIERVTGSPQTEKKP